MLHFLQIRFKIITSVLSVIRPTYKSPGNTNNIVVLKAGFTLPKVRDAM